MFVKVLPVMGACDRGQEHAVHNRQLPFWASMLVVALLSGCSLLPTKEPKNEESLAATVFPSLEKSGDTYALGTPEEELPDVTARVKSADESGNRVFPGTGRFVKPSTAKQSEVSSSKQGDVTLNFENTDVREVVDIILGDLLKVNYLVDPAVRGGVSMQSGRPLTRSMLLPTLETLLRMNGAAVVIDGQNTYHVMPLAKASKGMVTPQLADAVTPLPKGYSVQIVPLKYIAAAEMGKILGSLASEGNIVRADTQRNLLVLAGNRQELKYLLETIDTFDVDWVAGLSVGFFALNNTDVENVVKDLGAILQGESGDILDGLVRVVPISSANGLLVVTPQAHYLKEIGKWISRLDQLGVQDGNDEQLFVYRVRNGDAENLADLLNELLKDDKKKETKSASIAPGLQKKTVDSKNDKNTTDSTKKVSSSGSANRISGVSDLGSDIRIVADAEKNSLLIMATPRDYEKLEKVLETLDIMPLQVHVEASIIEVTLNGDLKYGLQWFFKTSHGSKRGEVSLDGSLDSSSGSDLGIFFPGFNWSITDSADQVRAVLSAFAGDTLVNVLSAPSVMVLDNHTAKIQVGDEVPVATQQQQNTDSTSTVINSIQYRDTGVMLSVKPRVNPGGLVTMEIEQEVSSVSQTDSSSLDSPTIQTRNISSTVAIASGQSVVLGGLIRDSESKGRGGIPVLYKLPVVGNLFGETNTESRRTELVVVLTPRVIENSVDARKITEDFRSKMQGLRGVF